jgi:K+-sensing histidine kinase KdpD
MNARTSGSVSSSGNAAGEILITGAHAIAHGDGIERMLQTLLDSVSDLGASSAAIVIAGRDGALEIVASFGLDDGAAAGLTEAIARPGHPIARTMQETTPTFDVLPTGAGGPALRSHLPLVVTRGGADSVLGVLALAHDAPIDPAMRSVLAAVADLAAVAVEREHHR